jgi:hypothetical protein
MGLWSIQGFVAGTLLATATGCNVGALELQEIRCPEPVGEFPPDGCAWLRGTLVPPVGPVASEFVVAVDTTDAESQSWFVAPPTGVPENGRLELLVVQVRPLGSPPVPPRATRTIDVRVYRTAAEARDRVPPRLAHPVAMVFGRWGQAVDYTDLVLHVLGK